MEQVCIFMYRYMQLQTVLCYSYIYDLIFITVFINKHN